jgi:hypothetical protein
MSQEDVGHRFDVKGGRVSEVLHGHYDPGGSKWDKMMTRVRRDIGRRSAPRASTPASSSSDPRTTKGPPGPRE